MNHFPVTGDRKRRIQFIDLTGDDDEPVALSQKKWKNENSFPSSSQIVNSSSSFGLPSSGSAYSLSQLSNPSYSSHSSSFGNSSQLHHTFAGSSTAHLPRVHRPVNVYVDDINFGDNEIDESLTQNFDGSETYELYGVIAAEIVGCRFYNGHVTPEEMVLLRREPQNRYDPNAIQVLNVRNEQIGHIPRTLAFKLAQFLDNKTLKLEGFTTGYKSFYACPVELRVFGPVDAVQKPMAKTAMANAKLPLSSLRDVKARDKDLAKRKKEQDKQNAQRIKELKRMAKLKGHGVGPGVDWDLSNSEYTSSQNPESLGVGPTLDEIIQESVRFDPCNVDQMVEKFGIIEDQLKKMEMAPQPKSIKSVLLPHQLQGLLWMQQKENPQLPELGSSETVQLWKRVSSNMVTNIATNFSLQNREPALARGGILADDMGLGKTLQVISLIMEAQNELSQHIGSSATLIVCPLSVMSNWTKQIKDHVKEELEPRVLVYHGPKRIPLNSKNIQEWDIVITTYDTIRVEHYQDSRSKPGLSTVNWRRIVLDEGHTIRNPAAKVANAICELDAHSRWVLTGTPIVNSLKDLYSMAKFLRISGGLDNFEVFNRAIIRPALTGMEKGISILQALMRSISLRRNKEMKFIDLELPELSEYLHRVDFHPHEKKLYDSLHDQAKGKLVEYREKQGRRGQDSGAAYRHLLEILLRMRQTCNYWGLVGEDRFKMLQSIEDQEVVNLTPQNKKALEVLLQLSIEAQENCSICLETLNEPVITTCKHAFCSACISRVIEIQHKCPLCRNVIDANALIKPAVQLGEDEEFDFDTNGSSSKIEALLTILKASRKGNGNKSVLFSQWTSFLDVVGPHLESNGFKFCRIDGKMSAPERDAAMYALEKDPEVTILLASLGVCSVGLNLVAANQVILMDSWWAPAIEDQAVDRVHRLGQKKPTSVFRLVMADSIEEHVLNIQQDKRKLALLALSEKGKRGNAAGAHLADIVSLLK